jgi:uncharacterized membrane protein
MEKFMQIMGSLFAWIPWAVVVIAAMSLGVYGIVLMGAFAVVFIVRQLNTIIQLLQEQNELLRQKNEKQE